MKCPVTGLKVNIRAHAHGAGLIILIDGHAAGNQGLGSLTWIRKIVV